MSLEDEYVLVTFAPYLSEGIEGGVKKYMKTRGFLPRDALPGGKAKWDSTINGHDIGCGVGESGYDKAPLDLDSRLDVVSPGFDKRDRYLGERSYVGKFDKSTSPWKVIEDPRCNRRYPEFCGPYRNYEGAEGMGTIVITNATTGVAGGGVARAILQDDKNQEWYALDEFSYTDPNVPCYVENAGRKHFYKRVAKWAYAHVSVGNGENKITGWLPLPRQNGPMRTGGSLCALAESEGIDLPVNYWAGWH